MKISKAHCLFEQSGTFKNEFIKLGIPAYDYDIQDNFGQTDFRNDLFREIETAFTGGGISIFDSMTCDDIIIAFFPCIYFCNFNATAFRINQRNYRGLTFQEKIEKILQREKNRSYFHRTLIKMYAVCRQRGLRLIIENPWTPPQYLQNNFPEPPTIVDYDRTLRGDFFKKPTAYWFVNCEPTRLVTFQKDKPQKRIKDARPGKAAGVCSEERSLISGDYARNFICDFILGREQNATEPTLFG